MSDQWQRLIDKMYCRFLIESTEQRREGRAILSSLLDGAYGFIRNSFGFPALDITKVATHQSVVCFRARCIP